MRLLSVFLFPSFFFCCGCAPENLEYEFQLIQIGEFLMSKIFDATQIAYFTTNDFTITHNYTSLGYTREVALRYPPSYHQRSAVRVEKVCYYKGPRKASLIEPLIEIDVARVDGEKTLFTLLAGRQQDMNYVVFGFQVTSRMDRDQRTCFWNMNPRMIF